MPLPGGAILFISREMRNSFITREDVRRARSERAKAKKRIELAVRVLGQLGETAPTPAKPNSVEGHDGHSLWELPTGGACKRRVYCGTCEAHLVETHEPVEFVSFTVLLEEEKP